MRIARVAVACGLSGVQAMVNGRLFEKNGGAYVPASAATIPETCRH
jgi:hypothetical protein